MLRAQRDFDPNAVVTERRCSVETAIRLDIHAQDEDLSLIVERGLVWQVELGSVDHVELQGVAAVQVPALCTQP